MKEIKDKIREARKRAGMTQEQLANKAGMKKQEISRYERGDRTPKLENLSRIASALEVPIEYFLELQVFDTPEQFNAKRQEIIDSMEPDDAGVTFTRLPDGTTIAVRSDQQDLVEKQIAEKRKEYIKETLDTFNPAGVMEVQHHVEIISQIPKFKKED